MRILIVEDDVIQQQLLACFLVQQGFDVETASSGLEAIRKARHESYHVILMDNAMPGFDGQPAASVIKRNRSELGYPWLIAVTANIARIISQESTAVPAFDVLIQKPWQPDHLLDVLKNCNRPATSRPELKAWAAGTDKPDYAVATLGIANRYAEYFQAQSYTAPATTKVLLIDGDPKLLDEFRTSLQALQYDVETASTRAEGLRKIEVASYDVVLANYLARDRFCGSAADFAKSGLGLPAPVASSPRPAPSLAIERLSQATPGPVITPLRILIVDDAALDRDILTSFVMGEGHQVTCVKSGAEAIANAADSDFDVIFMDVRMPLVDGLEATRQIRASGGVRACVPVIALAKQVAVDEMDLFAAAGMDGYLLKPFDFGSIQSVVAQAGRFKHLQDIQLDTNKQSHPLARSAVIGSELATLDQPTFDRTASCLGDRKTKAYVGTLTDNADALLHALRRAAGDPSLQRDALPDVHALGGSAGMFGFARLSEVSKSFEQASEAGAANVGQHLEGLTAALEVTLKALVSLGAHAADRDG